MSLRGVSTGMSHPEAVMVPPFEFWPEFVPDSDALYEAFAERIAWDERMRARRTASFGEPYDYSGISYPRTPFPTEIADLARRVWERVGFTPNNCLANHYPDGCSSMGFHSDAIDRLEAGSGIAIVSLGAARDLVFRPRTGSGDDHVRRLEPGSLLLMSAEMQSDWRHGLPACDDTGGRISLTFRRLIQAK